MNIAINSTFTPYKDNHITTPIQSFIRMFTTALGDRVMLPEFGSSLYTLIDREFNQEWVIDFKRFSLECCFDENGKLWDRRVHPKNMRVRKVNDVTNEFYIEFEIEFFNGESYELTIS